MINRRHFIQAGTAGAAALGMSGGAFALPRMSRVGASDVLSIASLARPLGMADQGDTHLVLNRDILHNLHQMEAVLTSAEAGTLRLSLDAADTLIFEIAMGRKGEAYLAVPSQLAGLTELNLKSTVAGV